MMKNIFYKKTLYNNFYPCLNIEANTQEKDRIGYHGMTCFHRKTYSYSIPIGIKPLVTKKLKHRQRKINKLFDKIGEENDI